MDKKTYLLYLKTQKTSAFIQNFNQMNKCGDPIRAINATIIDVFPTVYKISFAPFALHAKPII